ncbi:MAG: hypothetical protein Q8P74_01130 [bacterium]|nr:hypothetical protein [bacterium]
MKLESQKLAVKLRKRGWSLSEICKKQNLAKGSVSKWVRNVELSPLQIEIINKKGGNKKTIEKRRLTRIRNTEQKREKIISSADKEIKKLSNRDLFLIGIVLYWAEGRKANGGVVQFSNSDPRTIRIMIKFFTKICGVPPAKLRGYIHIHPHLDAKKAEKYWSLVSEIPLNQFYKTYRKQNKSSKNKKNSLPFGTFDINICDTNLFLKIRGWINGISRSLRAD